MTEVIRTDNTDVIANACKKIAELEKHNEKLIALINAERERQEKCDDVHLQRIAELEKENAELKAVERMALYSKLSDQLTKAKEIIKKLMEFAEMDDREYEEEYKEAEQFLTEVEK